MYVYVYVSAKPQAQLLGELPIEQITWDFMLDMLGVDYQFTLSMNIST